jgi:hypothetical protein
MQGSKSRDWDFGRFFSEAVWPRILILCVLPLLSGCIPGMNWGDDEPDSGTLTTDSKGTPALNRSYKSSFLSLQTPSLGAVPNVRGLFMPDSGPSIFNAAFSTVEARKIASPGIRGIPGAGPSGAPAFEPAVLPPARSLANFYAALAALVAGRHPKPITVVHFGDDRIADDRFAGALRELLIGRFGGGGRGLMMPGLYPLRGMKVDRAGQWTLDSAAAGAPGPFGITAVRMTSSESNAWLRFTLAQSTFDWAEVTFMTGPGAGTALISLDGGATKAVPTRAPAANETSIRIPARAREILIKPRGDGPVSILSVATGTNSPGISYSNLGLPGATAWTLGKWTADFAANEFRKLNPDLILLEYGTREGFDDGLDLRGYEMNLRLVIDQIKEWAPQASLLVIGPPDAARLPAFAGSAGAQVCRALNAQEAATYDRMMDRADERLARWHAPPRLEAVRSALRRTAAGSGAYFWDWAKYMGGPCSVHAWGSFTPPLAAPDHTTLTEAGDDRSARALFAELIAGYDTYQRALQAKAQAIVTSAGVKVTAPPRTAVKKRVSQPPQAQRN